MKFIFAMIILMFVSRAAFSADYCMAIRGAGQNGLAHAPEEAKMIEAHGIPSAVAGGSSASASAFMLESVIMNPAVGAASGDEKESAKRAAFLLKSFEGLGQLAASDPRFQYVAQLVQQQQPGSSTVPFPQRLAGALAGLNSANPAAARAATLAALEQAKASEVFYGPAVRKLDEEMRSSNPNPLRVQALAAEVKTSVEKLGEFDAKGDQTLFLRDGVVDFKALSKLTGNIADFYAMSEAKQPLKDRMNAYVQTCSANSPGQSWSTIVAASPACKTDLETLFKDYRAEVATRPINKQNIRAKEPVGAHLPALISTAVVTGKSATDLKNLKSTYDSTFQPALGDRVKLKQAHVKTGYWGPRDRMSAVMNNTGKGRGCLKVIEKAKKENVMDLGSGSWETAMSTSAAEPGLSSFVPIGDGRNVSVGGWADLAPIPVLLASGCSKVGYVQRIDGESLFNEGVQNRLLDLGHPWDKINKKDNNTGDPSDMTSNFSKKFNIKNPESDLACSIRHANLIACSDWNEHSLNDPAALIASGHKAKFAENGEKIPRIGLIDPEMITAADNTLGTQGYKYAGCIPVDTPIGRRGTGRPTNR